MHPCRRDTVLEIKLQQRVDDRRIYRELNRTPPVRVAAEHGRVRFRRPVMDAVFFAVHAENVRVLSVLTGERPDAAGVKCPWTVYTDVNELMALARFW
jgi:hypothetical protein